MIVGWLVGLLMINSLSIGLLCSGPRCPKSVTLMHNVLILRDEEGWQVLVSWEVDNWLLVDQEGGKARGGGCMLMGARCKVQGAQSQ